MKFLNLFLYFLYFITIQKLCYANDDCSEHCLTCNVDNLNCTSCDEGYVLKFYDLKSIDPIYNCGEEGFIQDRSLWCGDGCKTCYGESNNCTSCYDTNELIQVEEEENEDGEIQQQFSCMGPIKNNTEEPGSCNPNCEICRYDYWYYETICITCYEGELQEVSDWRPPVCPNVYCEGEGNEFCYACDYQTKQCLLCSYEYHLENGVCVEGYVDEYIEYSYCEPYCELVNERDDLSWQYYDLNNEIMKVIVIGIISCVCFTSCCCFKLQDTKAILNRYKMLKQQQPNVYVENQQVNQAQAQNQQVNYPQAQNQQVN